MNKVEQIKAEIERRKGICMAQIKTAPGHVFPFLMEMTGYDKILSFIDTLPEEKPSEDLSEETITKEFHTIDEKCFNEGIEGWQREKLIARHFAKWQKEQMMNYVQGKYNAYQEEYDDYYAGLRAAYSSILDKLKEEEK